MKAHCPPCRIQTEMTFMGQCCLVTDLSHPVSPSDPTFAKHQRVVMWDHPTREEPLALGLNRGATEYLNDLGAICIGRDAPSIDSHTEAARVKVQPAHAGRRASG